MFKIFGRIFPEINYESTLKAELQATHSALQTLAIHGLHLQAAMEEHNSAHAKLLKRQARLQAQLEDLS